MKWVTRYINYRHEDVENGHGRKIGHIKSDGIIWRVELYHNAALKYESNELRQCLGFVDGVERGLDMAAPFVMMG